MNPIQHTSRRTFLGTLGTLAAGLACGPVISACSGRENALQQEWAVFCRRHAGVPFNGTLPNKEPGADTGPCPGHTHVPGRIICFPHEAMLAQPVWIYWADRKQPADLIIRFYRNEPGHPQSASVDRFALEGLNLLTATEPLPIPGLQEEIRWICSAPQHGRRPVCLRIQRKQEAHCLTVTDVQRNIRLEKTIIYHI